MPGNKLAGVSSRFFGIVVALSLVVVPGCEQFAGRSPAEQEPRPPARPLFVNVRPAEYVENIDRSHLSFGTVRPAKSSTLGFARGGQVTDVAVGVGAAVRKGETLARLEQEELQRQRDLLDQAVNSSRKTLANLESNPNAVNLQQQIAEAKQRVERQESQRREIDIELAKGILSAPYDGVIAERYVHIGDSIGSGRPVIRILGNGKPTIELNLPANIASRLKVGQSVSIGKDALQAAVSTKSPELDVASQTQRIDCEFIADPEADWTFGDAVEVRFDLQSQRSGFWLPYSALKRATNGLWTAFVAVGNGDPRIVERRTLTVELPQGQFVLVRGALAEGDLVIVDGLNRIVAGQTVFVDDSAARSREREVPTTSHEFESAFPANESGEGT